MGDLRFFDVPLLIRSLAIALVAGSFVYAADEADLILLHGKVVTVDRDFSLREAMAVKEGRIVEVGSDAEVLKSRGEKTKVIDLADKMVLPGLGDSHVHPADAAMTEFDHPVPDMESIADVLDYIKSRAAVVNEGRWIVVKQVFITRLREQRYPTKAELDAAAPRHPVVFSTGPDASANSLALAKSGIDKNFQATGAGKVEKDPVTGEPTGILRSAMQYLKVPPEKKATPDERDERLLTLLRDYASVGITSIIDRDASRDDVEQYRRLHAAKKLPVRVRLSHHVENLGKTSDIVAEIQRIATDPLFRGDDRLRIIGLKTFLDGGMLTGSAYMLRPWGVSRIYSIDDPRYRGMLYIPHETLVPMVRAAVENGLQFTAHSVGDGAVQALLDAYEEVNRSLPIAPTRPCITHSNFMTKEAIEQAARLGVMVDIQPAWLYLDTRTLVAHFGYDRLRYFQPLKTLFEYGVTAGGGSDHMQKIGSLRSINPYDPWFAIWVTLTRQARWHEGALHQEEALSREQAIRFYTINNARIMFLDDRAGSLETGKLADFVIIDRDLLSCPVDGIRETKVVATYIDGRPAFERSK
jgi:predicted amidohydrolase YtcJ